MRLWFYCNFNNPIQLVLKEVVSLLDIFQLIAVGDQRGGVDLALFDQAENLLAQSQPSAPPVLFLFSCFSNRLHAAVNEIHQV